MMRPIFRLHARFGHVSDETLADLISGELSGFRTMRVNAHLGSCWQCLSRHEELQKAALRVIEYRKRSFATYLPLDPGCRQSFLVRLRQMMENQAAAYQWFRLLPISVSPAYVGAMAMGLALLLLFWTWQRPPAIPSAGTVLERAEISEAQRALQPGVLYQQVEIRTRNSSIRRSIYRDLSDRRRKRRAAETVELPAIKVEMEHAGLDWDDPLSAGMYRSWHDHQPQLTDVVRHTGNELLTLTTTVGGNEGAIAWESLTVRASDFHPVGRTVETRNQERVEIAELNSAVLGPDVIPALFAPLASSGPLEPSAPLIRGAWVQTLPTLVQLDSAELAARIVLHQLGADTQDQIRVRHADASVIVQGIVATNQRKRELVSRLRQIAYVRSEILSNEEIRNHPSGALSSTAANPVLRAYAAPTQLAPLAKFLQERNVPKEQWSQISGQLLDGCLKAARNEAYFTELEQGFILSNELPQQSQQSLQLLQDTYREAMNAGLSAELSVLAQIGLTEAAASRQSPGETASVDHMALPQYVHDNQILCRELIAATGDELRPASIVSADLEKSIQKIRLALAAR